MGIASRKRRRTKKLAKNVQQPKKKNRPNSKKHLIPNKGAKYIRELWSNARTVKENYENIGIAYDANEIIGQKQRLLEEEIDIEDIGKEDDLDYFLDKAKSMSSEEGVEELKEKLHVPEPAPPKEPNLGLRERWYWLRLYRKYKDNYGAMARDMKLNYRQFTKAQCKKKIQILLERHQNFLEAADE